jgi:hypothetical protein
LSIITEKTKPVRKPDNLIIDITLDFIKKYSLINLNESNPIFPKESKLLDDLLEDEKVLCEQLFYFYFDFNSCFKLMNIRNDFIDLVCSNELKQRLNGNFKKELYDKLKFLFEKLLLKSNGKSIFNTYFRETKHWHSDLDLNQKYDDNKSKKDIDKEKHGKSKIIKWIGENQFLRKNVFIDLSQTLDTEFIIAKQKKFSGNQKIREKILNPNLNFEASIDKLLKHLKNDNLPFNDIEDLRQIICKVLRKKLNESFNIEQDLLVILNLLKFSNYEFEKKDIDLISKLITKFPSSKYKNFPKFEKFEKELLEMNLLKPTLTEFQMESFGSSFLRNQNPKFFKHKDITFYPDGWQNDFLERILKGDSILLTAPTSSGKTFTAVFAISKALSLNQNNDNVKKSIKKSNILQMKSVVVFVAATQSMAYYMHAFIQTRYKNVCGIALVDYRENQFESDILVTIPSHFELLINSPINREWANNLKYVVFDDMHHRHDKDEENYKLDSKYAKCMSSIICPFLALSASIFNQDQVIEWMKLNRINTGGEIIATPKNSQSDPLIRWVDLKLFYFNPIFKTLKHVHPIVLCNNIQDLKNIDNISPDECLKLYQTIKQIINENNLNKNNENYQNLELISPDEFFGIEPSKSTNRNYFKEIIKYIEKLNILEQIISKLSIGLEFSDQDFELYSINENMENIIKDVDEIHAFLIQLKNQNKAPSLLFSNSDSVNQTLLIKLSEILNNLKKVENQQIFTEPTEEIDDNHNNDNDNDENNNRKQKISSKNEKDKKVIYMNPFIQKFNDWKNFVCTIDQKNSFANWGSMDKTAIDLFIKNLKKTGWGASNPLLICLGFGIAFHSDEIHKSYRKLVEYCFRNRMISFIFTANSLGVGISLPVKSCIFFTSDLDVMDYKQKCGRAGRRGFDTEGFIIFYGSKKSSISKLHLSKNEYLTIPSPLDANTSLKIMMNIFPENNPKIEKDKTFFRMSQLIKPSLNLNPLTIVNYIQNNFINSNNNNNNNNNNNDNNNPISNNNDPISNNDNYNQKKFKFKDEQISFKANLEFLYRMKLIDFEGKILLLGGLCNRLTEITPNNYFLCFMIQKGCFDSVIISFKSKELHKKEKAKKDLVRLLSEVICKKECRNGAIPLERYDLREIYNDYESITNNIVEKVENSFGITPSYFKVNIKNQAINSYAFQFYTIKEESYHTAMIKGKLSDYMAYKSLKEWISVLLKIGNFFKKVDENLDILSIMCLELAQEFQDSFDKTQKYNEFSKK